MWVHVGIVKPTTLKVPRCSELSPTSFNAFKMIAIKGFQKRIFIWLIAFITGYIFFFYKKTLTVRTESFTRMKDFQKDSILGIVEILDVLRTRKELLLKNSSKLDRGRGSEYQFNKLLHCDGIKKLLNQSLLEHHKQNRHENELGNKGIYFTTMKNRDQPPSQVVIKVATLHINASHEESDKYRYRMALKEIDILHKLERLHVKGFPKLHGSCISSRQILYVVEKIQGRPFCRGFKMTPECLKAQELVNSLERTSNPELNTMIFLSKVTCFFEQFEKFHIFMEDVSGTNLFFNEKTFDVNVVDVDSLLFYENTSINSRSVCKSNEHCPVFRGNFWKKKSPNLKLYSNCQELNGYCKNNSCRGINSSIHVCGIATWLVSAVNSTVPLMNNEKYKDLLQCMTEPYPEHRCSFAYACQTFTRELFLYRKTFTQLN